MILRLAENTKLRTLQVRYNVKMFLAREEGSRCNAPKNPPTRVVTRQPNLLMRVPDTSPEN